ncbi:hypothetical protein R1sor_015168 [Riccia sorocarpa]|uniref:Myb/SANT-like DNA-binding domain-containing protein n=1 Tax=Riccia sorocarpa TaxID=122646 RepID=A0ABD3HEH2_9MARC
MASRSCDDGEDASHGNTGKGVPGQDQRSNVGNALENLEIVMGDLCELDFLTKKATDLAGLCELRELIHQMSSKIHSSQELVGAVIMEISALQVAIDAPSDSEYSEILKELDIGDQEYDECEIPPGINIHNGYESDSSCECDMHRMAKGESDYPTKDRTQTSKTASATQDERGVDMAEQRVDMAERRPWEDGETVSLICAVRRVTTREHVNPRNFRIWPQITTMLAEQGIVRTERQVKAKWDRTFGQYIKVVDHQRKTGVDDYFSMSVTYRHNIGLPSEFPRLWFDEISEFIELNM